MSTASASLVVPGIFKCMRDSQKFDYRIIAVDVMPSGVGAHFADAYHLVPMGNEGEGYVSAVLDLCRQENVSIVLPISDEENLTLSRHKRLFEEQGVKVLCNDYEATRIALRKDLALEKLENDGVAVPSWKAPKSMDDFDEGLRDLGFPENDVVIKPISTRGSRGFRIIKADFDEFGHVCNDKQEVYIKADRIRRILEEQSDFPPVLLMEYLPGSSFSIDILAEHGDVRCIVPHERRAYRWGFVDRARLAPHSEACAMCREIVEAFKFDNLVNIELNLNGQKLPRLVEINPRASATLAQNRLAGLNILDMAVAAAFDEPFDIPTTFKNVEYIMYWSDVVTSLGESPAC